MLFCYSSSNVSFAHSSEAGGSKDASVVDHTHWLMAAVPRNADLVIFNDILLNYGLSGRLTLALDNCIRVDVSAREEPIVTRNVRSSFSCSNAKEMINN